MAACGGGSDPHWRTGGSPRGEGRGMRAMAQLRAVRVVLAIGVSLRALAWGIGAGFTLILGAAAIDLVSPRALATRSALVGVAIVAAVAVALSLAWRDRHALALTDVALWIEERFPTLEYTLVTAVETGDGSFVD